MDATQTLVGRLVKVARDAGCGFIRSASGAILYFEQSDLDGGAGALRGLRDRALLSYRPAGAGIPRAVSVSIAA